MRNPLESSIIVLIMVPEGEVIMKKVSFRVRNFDTEQFLTFDIDNEAELDEELLDFLEDEEPRGIVPVIFEDGGDEQDTFSYNITDKIHLSELSNQEINAEMVLMVMRGIVKALINMAENRIPLSYLVLHSNYIYIDSDYRVEFICIPLADMQETVDVNRFLRNLIASVRFDTSENGDYVAKMLSYVNNPAIFNLHNMLTLVEELMENYGIEIPEDDSSDIYADYKEVEEKSAADIVEELDDDSEDNFVEDMSANELDDDIDIPTINNVVEEIPTETTEEETIEEEAEEEQPEETIEEEAARDETEEIVEDEVVEEPDEIAEDEPASEEPDEIVKEEAASEEPEEITPDEIVEEELDEIVGNEVVEEEPKETIEEEVAQEEPDEIMEEYAVEQELADTTLDGPAEDIIEDEAAWEQSEEIPDESEDTKTTEEAQEIVEQLKNKAKASVQTEDADEFEEDADKKKGFLKPVFKTKETTITGTVIPDELDEFLAEKEREEQEQAAHHEESSLKIKKNIKVSRASIVKNSQEATEDTPLESLAESDERENHDTDAADSAASQQAANTPVPKVNPYLLRVNTDERIMITKQTFKIGKASVVADYAVKGNNAISRVHAIITNKDGVYSIKDNKSTNHTFVNGKILDDGESAELTNDSKIVLGDEEFIFKMS